MCVSVYVLSLIDGFLLNIPHAILPKNIVWILITTFFQSFTHTRHRRRQLKRFHLRPTLALKRFDVRINSIESWQIGSIFHFQCLTFSLFLQLKSQQQFVRELTFFFLFLLSFASSWWFEGIFTSFIFHLFLCSVVMLWGREMLKFFRRCHDPHMRHSFDWKSRRFF